MRTRNELLIELIQNKKEISALTEELSFYPWDCEEALYTITSEDVDRVFDQYSNSIIDSKTLEDWANAIESRDDLDFETEEIQNIISEIANPVLFGNISTEKLEYYREKLRT